MSKTDQLYKIANHFVDIHVPDIILLISYLLWRINISSFCFCSNEVKLFFSKFNLNCTTYHLNVTMNYCMISEKHWHKKWNQCYIRDMKHIFSNSESIFEIHQDRSIYIHLYVQTDDWVKSLSGLVTMNKQERFKLYKTNGARSGRYGGWVARR